MHPETGPRIFGGVTELNAQAMRRPAFRIRVRNAVHNLAARVPDAPAIWATAFVPLCFFFARWRLCCALICARPGVMLEDDFPRALPTGSDPGDASHQ